MRVLVTVSDQAWGGKHRYTLDVAAGLRAAGHDVVLAAERGGRSLDAWPEPVAAPVFRDHPEEAAAVLRERVGAPDVVCATGRHDAAVVRGLLREDGWPSALVLFRHSAFPLEQGEGTRWLLDRAGLVVATSWEQARAQFGDLVAARDPRLLVLLSGVRAGLADAVAALDRDRLRADLGIAPGQCAFAVLARLSWEKGIDRLLRAFALVAVDPAPVLLLVGEGEQRAELEALAASAGIADRVRFLGHHDDVLPVLAAADAAVLASTVPETGPLALKESMAAGLPVVAPAIGGIPEFVTDSCSGLLFADDDGLRDALTRLASSERLRELLGRGARAAIEEGHRLDRRVEHLLWRLDLLLAERGDVDRLLGELSWDEVRLRREADTGFVFVPRTSYLAELDAATHADVAQAVRAGDPALLLGTGSHPRRALVDQLYRMGALRRADTAAALVATA
ncbi:glycosyltransferase family 4 protein [Actinosynnema pretiosum subsp. pretiosum]|uniref:Glycosyltransferase family 4 protein n=1 Tax=Actinosynnema pretiosum subsp. pretiosum TaxID=103721 RepID=A0AA45L9N5_9PSEU|nr:Cell division protein FtsI [Actinosynnema pretiosum subsp. pretiosum]QUF05633.1 glycosyltransferase family 4 protein [Actinosynnema pretiosum subsp. pretiosum]